LLVIAGCQGAGARSWFQRDKPAEHAHGGDAKGDNSGDVEVAAGPAVEIPIPSSEPSKPVNVLLVNGDSVTAEQALAPVRDELANQATILPPDRYRARRDEIVVQVVRDVIRRTLLYQEALKSFGEQENKMIDDFTDRRIREIVQKEHYGREARWLQSLAAQGISREEGRERIRKEMVVQAFLERNIKPRIQEPTRADLWHIYETRKDELVQPERREMWLIELPKGPDPEAARALAQKLVGDLRRGADFAETARQHSQGVHASDGGNWGMINPQSIRGRWVRAVEVLSTLQSSQVSDVVDAGESYFIVRAGRIEPRVEPNFPAMQPVLKEAYLRDQFDYFVDALVARLEKDAIYRPENISLFLEGVAAACPSPPGGTP
jgi:hypothetical protein